MEKEKTSYFTTRDLMMMATLAAMGGIASTYINLIGDFFQSFLGFAGTTQWAAGLHIIWLMLAAALINKAGAATATGIIKGFVELLSGNTHGLLVLIIDVSAGLIIDLILLPQKDKKPGMLFFLAAGLASASNVFIFQFFASIPKDILTFLAILVTSSVSFLSGVIFGGFLVKGLLISLEKIGLYTVQQRPPSSKKIWPVVIGITAILLIAGSGWFYFKQQTNTQTIAIDGNVANPYQFPDKANVIPEIEVQASINNATRKYTGYPLSKIIDFAKPLDNSGDLQITASDGYSFFIPMEEVYSNNNLIITQEKAGSNALFNIVGALSSKAWVRGINEIKLIKINGIEVKGKVSNPFVFVPDQWVPEMDSTAVNVNGETKKLQGVPLENLWEKAQPTDRATLMVLLSLNNAYEIGKDKFLANDSIRIFINLTPQGTQYLLGTMTGELIFDGITSIEIK
jgi:ABC-type thiamin/hydroxymethylpyrimidine transport system permease subunit